MLSRLASLSAWGTHVHVMRWKNEGGGSLQRMSGMTPVTSADKITMARLAWLGREAQIVWRDRRKVLASSVRRTVIK
ncbi:hypothetical protein N7466_011187 [Penicillium verhagenii]|uniref:uncharacterized protein n=1 Tax=Penicillium verhagenii TaxID=1562060 RepID=UPI0025454CBA|nr:uncharacterized protein N7466_011187 [Penicillium verhagenii]KAJ5917633.1 hypothetical protein N7466_011187 [Penicillium verhagenii]